METLGYPKNEKKRMVYNCFFCDFNTCKKTDYSKHLLTIKHQRICLEINSRNKTNNNYECVCGKKYNNNSGLWKHKKICLELANTNENIENNMTETKVQQLTDIIKTLITDNSEIKNLVMVQQQNMVSQQNTITELVKNSITNNSNSYNTTINSNNKAFDLNFFLNETCKDAMNLTDFIDSLQIEYDDFEKLGEIGFVNGISNIIIKSLKELDITQRPVHCTDKKREILYVKDENKWEKEDDKYLKIRKLIKKAAYKNTRMIYKFKEKYPDYNKSESPNSDRYDLLVIETMGGRGDNDYEKETKILKNIAKEIFINKQ
jgi:hypothetical protein